MPTAVTEVVSGRKVDLLHPDKYSIGPIEEVAESLARQCRFGGHISTRIEHYSVAEHSVLVSQQLPPNLQLVGLLHDVTEYLLTDLPTPAKVALPAYYVLEKRVWNDALVPRFGVPRFEDVDPRVWEADRRMLITERNFLRDSYDPSIWPSGEPYPDVRLLCLPWREAARLFVNTFYKISA